MSGQTTTYPAWTHARQPPARERTRLGLVILAAWLVALPVGLARTQLEFEAMRHDATQRSRMLARQAHLRQESQLALGQPNRQLAMSQPFER